MRSEGTKSFPPSTSLNHVAASSTAKVVAQSGATGTLSSDQAPQKIASKASA